VLELHSLLESEALLNKLQVLFVAHETAESVNGRTEIQTPIKKARQSLDQDTLTVDKSIFDSQESR